jgi:hypothetical protein
MTKGSLAAQLRLRLVGPIRVQKIRSLTRHATNERSDPTNPLPATHWHDEREGPIAKKANRLDIPPASVFDISS